MREVSISKSISFPRPRLVVTRRPAALISCICSDPKSLTMSFSFYVSAGHCHVALESSVLRHFASHCRSARSAGPVHRASPMPPGLPKDLPLGLPEDTVDPLQTSSEPTGADRHPRLSPRRRPILNLMRRRSFTSYIRMLRPSRASTWQATPPSLTSLRRRCPRQIS